MVVVAIASLLECAIWGTQWNLTHIIGLQSRCVKTQEVIYMEHSLRWAGLIFRIAFDMEIQTLELQKNRETNVSYWCEIERILEICKDWMCLILRRNH